MDRPAIPREGSVIGGKYRVVGEIATGGMGVVLRATHLHLRESVAIKILRPDILRPASVARFMREARMTMKISSEHVVRVFDVDVMYGRLPYIVMECLEGEDLSLRLAKSGRLAPAVVTDWLRQTCKGVAAAHALGIIHRDLKPANLFLTTRADGTTCVKVLDFGVSKPLSFLFDDDAETAPGSDPKLPVAEKADEDSVDLTSTRTVLGSPRYMSPEQVRSSRLVDVRTDIWAIGAIGYEMLSGDPPFAGDDLEALRRDITDRDPLPVEGPPELRAIIERCLEKDPDRRFPDVAALSRALDGLAAPSRRVWPLAAAAAAIAAFGIAVTRWPHPAPTAPARAPESVAPTTTASMAPPSPSIAPSTVISTPLPTASSKVVVRTKPTTSQATIAPVDAGLAPPSEHVFDNPE